MSFLLKKTIVFPNFMPYYNTVYKTNLLTTKLYDHEKNFLFYDRNHCMFIIMQ